MLNKAVFVDLNIGDQDECKVKDIEVMAIKYPDCNWCIVYSRPLSESVYQR